jgi:hypothetical protein
MTGAGTEVATLLGHAQMEMALTCLGSLRRLSAEPLRLRIHDDGTLTPGDQERLREGLGDPAFVLRPEADARLEDLLAGRPALRAFRRSNPLGLKLLDAPLLAGGEALAYCDSDVLFLRPFSGLFRFPGPEAGAIFMSDRQNAYSLRSWHLLRHSRLRLPCRINTGILHFRLRFFDPDLVEWYLSRPELGFAPVWAEQTAWALLGASAACRLWDPRKIRLPEPGEEETGEIVALHFVSPLRGLMLPVLERMPDRSGEPPISLTTIPAQRCHAWHLAGTEARRRLTRQVWR